MIKLYLITLKMLSFTQTERSLKKHVFSLKVKCPISVKRVEYILVRKVPFPTIWPDVEEKKNDAILKNVGLIFSGHQKCLLLVNLKETSKRTLFH